MKLSEVMDNAEDEWDFDVDAIRKVWWKCTVCQQFFKGDVFAKLAEEFVAMASNKYPNHSELKVEALRFKFEATRRGSIDERVPVLNELVAATESIISESGITTSSLLDNAQFAYMSLGDISLEKGDAAKAVHHYTKCKELYHGVKNNNWSLKKIDVYIAEANARMPGVDRIAYLKSNMHIYKDFYELTKEKYGNVSHQALCASDFLEGALFDSEQFVSYERQLIASYEMSRQLHGVNHPKTLNLKDDLDYIKERNAV